MAMRASIKSLVCAAVASCAVCGRPAMVEEECAIAFGLSTDVFDFTPGLCAKEKLLNGDPIRDAAMMCCGHSLAPGLEMPEGFRTVTFSLSFTNVGVAGANESLFERPRSLAMGELVRR